MSIHWICRSLGCGFETENAHEAFLHRSGDEHHPVPVRTDAELETRLLIGRSEYSGLRVIRSMGEA